MAIKKEKEKEVDYKEGALEAAIASLEKRHGQGIIIDDDHLPTNIEAISTGCYAVDGLLGCGGLPRGRVIEMFGLEGSGKSTLCLFFASIVQKTAGKVLYIDAEQGYSKQYAQTIGVDTEKLLFAQPTTLEQAMDVARTFIASNAVDLIIIDSVAAMTPESEFEEGAMDKETMAKKARILGRYIPILVNEIAKAKTVLILINQLRSSLNPYGEPDITPGGKALKFFSSVRIRVNKGEAIKEGTAQIGNRMKLTAKKNKVGFPFKEAEVDLYYASGVDLITDAIDAGVEHGVIVKKGNTYEYGEKKLGVGKEQARGLLREDSGLFADIKRAIDGAIAEKRAGATGVREDKQR